MSTAKRFAYGLAAAGISAGVEVSAVRSRLLSRPCPVLAQRGELPSGASDVCVFAHHRKSGGVAPYVLHHLAMLRGAGFRTVFISTSPLDESAWTQLSLLVDVVAVRPNVGWDFGSYLEGVRLIGRRIEDLSSLILTNDSVYGPFGDLGDFVGSLHSRDPGVDVWGVTDSWGHRYHLQSYFLYFLPPALRSASFLAFWETMTLMRSREAVVRKQEIGLTQTLVSAGIRCRAALPYRELLGGFLAHRQSAGGLADRQTATEDIDYRSMVQHAALRGQPLNPSHFLWDEILRRGGPYLKRNLLRNNPTNNPFLRTWPALVGATDYDLRLIEQDLELVMKNHFS